ncbi:MAG TPA: CBS domain-containing protein [Nitrososphaeraceae archaeon]|jgi:CBS domain-containing protein|nr:CBS domain-containing protein [Nitrososphaeraceae archaeon]
MFETNDGSYLLLNYAIRHMEEVVRNIMTREVITIEENRTVRDAAELMTANQISSLIVEKNQNAIGIISERDFVRKICSKDLLPSKILVSDIMSSIAQTAEPDTPLEVAVQRMINHKIRRLPVLEKGKIVGIVTVTDLAKELRKIVLHEEVLSDLLDSQ